MSGVRVPAPPPLAVGIRLRRIEPVLRRALAGPCAVRDGSRVLAAVSGGADSTALLVGLASIARERGLVLIAAHLHHGVRGTDADGDLDAVRTLCRRLRVPLEDGRMDGGAALARRGLAGEAGLRTLRRAFLIATAARVEADVVATGHTADDQLETLLMRLARGAGLRGLSGMRPRAGRFVKPLLEATRADIVADLTRARLAWREDRTNGDRAMLRNRLRHDVVPALARAVAPLAAPEATRARLARRAVRAAAEAAAAGRRVARWADAVLARVSRIQAGAIELDREAWSAYSIPARRLLLTRLWSGLSPAPPGLTDRHLDTLARLATAPGRRARVELPGGFTATGGTDRVRLSGPPGWTASRRSARLRGPGHRR